MSIQYSVITIAQKHMQQAAQEVWHDKQFKDPNIAKILGLNPFSEIGDVKDVFFIHACH